MKTKKIKKTNKKNQTAPRKKVRSYEAHYLALALIAVLVVEGVAGTYISAADWKSGVAVLDFSSTMPQTLQQINYVFEGVNQFYQIAATEMIPVLDLSNNGPIDNGALVASSVYEFYQQSSNQMASLIDFSHTAAWHGSVAGISVSR